MKKIFLLLALVCATTMVGAQDISFLYHDEPVANGDTIVVDAWPGDIMKAVHFNMHNNTSEDITNAKVKCVNTDSRDFDIEIVSLCYGLCLPGTLSPKFDLAANSTGADILFFDFNVTDNAEVGKEHILKMTVGDNAEDYDNRGMIYVKIIVRGVGIEEATSTTVKTFPNPATEVVNIVAEENIESVCVVNILGQEVYSNSNVNAASLQLNVRDYATGLYIVTVKTDKGIRTQRIFRM